MAGAILSRTVIVVTLLTLPAISLAVMESFVPAVCLAIVILNFPVLSATLLLSTFVPALTVTVAFASAVPVTNVVFAFNSDGQLIFVADIVFQLDGH